MPVSTTVSWATDLQIGPERKQYVVQLKRTVGCCYEGDYQIFVNGKELEDHGLTYQPCGPLCTSGGNYEWNQDGHRFHLMYDKGGRNDKFFRLFVDGIDIDTGFEFTAYWRRRAIQIFVTGCILVFLVALIYILVFVAFKVNIKHLGSMSGINVVFVFGVVYITVAVIIFKKFIHPKYNVASSSFPMADYQSFRDV